MPNDPNSLLYIINKYSKKFLKFGIILYGPSKKTHQSLADVMNLTKSNSNLVLKYIV